LIRRRCATAHYLSVTDRKGNRTWRIGVRRLVSELRAHVVAETDLTEGASGHRGRFIDALKLSNDLARVG
jgi:hypothetical protein